MNWVIFSVLTGLVVFNLLGVGIFHYEWRVDPFNKEWNNKDFWKWTIYLLLFGTAYCVIRLVLWIKSLFVK